MARTEQTPTLNRLVDKGLLFDGVHRWGTARQEKYESLLSDTGRRAIEPQVTTLMSVFAGALEASTIRFFCKKTGRDYHNRMQVIPGNDFARHTKQKSRRQLDLVITDSETVDSLERWTPEIVIEAKYGGDVNGDFGFCPKDTVAYSNQITCYPDGCINESVDHRKGVGFVWLGLEQRRPDLGPWGTAGPHQRWADRQADPRYAHALKHQNAIAHVWKGATWSELGQWLSDPATGLVDDDLPLILRILRAV